MNQFFSKLGNMKPPEKLSSSQKNPTHIIFEKLMPYLFLRDWVNLREVCQEWKLVLSKINYLCIKLDADYLMQHQKLTRTHMVQWFDLLNINLPITIKLSKTSSNSDIQLIIDCGICDTIKFGVFESRSFLRKKTFVVRPLQWDSKMVSTVKITVSQLDHNPTSSKNTKITKTFIRSDNILEQKFKILYDSPWIFNLQLFPESSVGPVYMLSKEIASHHQINIVENNEVRVKKFQVLFDDDVAHLTTVKILEEYPLQPFIIILKMGFVYLCRAKYKSIYKVITKTITINSKTDINGFLGRISGEWLNTSICTLDKINIASKLWNMPTLSSIIKNVNLSNDEDYAITDFL